MQRTRPAAPALALAMALAGCMPSNKAEIRPDSKDAAVAPASFDAGALAKAQGGVPIQATSARVIAPRRCGLEIAILARPEKEGTLEDLLWRTADEQAVPDAVRHQLEANGLRVGVLSGSLPREVDAILRPPPPGKKVDIVQIDMPDGMKTEIPLAVAEKPITLLLNRDGRARGRDYDDAKGQLRVSGVQAGPGVVRLRVVPELLFGPTKRGYVTSPGVGPYEPKEFMLKDGQAEEAFTDLAVEVDVRPGQVVAIGGRGDAPRGLGGFLFTKKEAEGDRLEHQVVLIWARPDGNLGNASPTPPARSPFFRRPRDKAKVKDAAPAPAPIPRA